MVEKEIDFSFGAYDFLLEYLLAEGVLIWRWTCGNLSDGRGVSSTEQGNEELPNACHTINLPNTKSPIPPK